MKLAKESLTIEELGFSGEYRDATLMAKAHSHDEVELNFIEDGSLTYLVSGERVVVTDHRFAIFWASVPHKVVHVKEGTKFYWFTVPLTLVVPWIAQDQWFLDRLLNGVVSVDQHPFDYDGLLCRQWIGDIQSGSTDRKQIAKIEIEARIKRFIQLSSTTDRAQTHQRSAAASLGKTVDHVQTMVNYIAKNYTEEITLQDVADAAGIHMNYAVNIFREVTGYRILEYITRHRLFHAKRLLITSDLTILEIALDSGFGSSSRFYSAFKSAFGNAPGEHRRNAGGVVIQR